MKIRTLTDADAEAFWALRLRALKECPEVFAASYEEEAEIPPGSIPHRFRTMYVPREESFILGAFVEERLVGMAGFRREKRRKLRHRAVVWGMYVAPEVRDGGIGRSMLSEAIGRARQLPGLEQINLTVVTTNVPARSLYLSLGFETFGIERRALKVGERYLDDEHMVLFLQSAVGSGGAQADGLKGERHTC